MTMIKRELEQQKKLTEKLNYFLKGDIAAVHLCLNLTYIAHLWDDLFDRDRQRSGQDINDAFRIALVDIPLNRFYLEYITDLRPLIMNAILQWEDANILDHGNDHDQHMAFMLRASFAQIFNYCAYLVGGPDWAREVGPEMRRLYDESFDEYKKEMEVNKKCQIQSSPE